MNNKPPPPTIPPRPLNSIPPTSDTHQIPMTTPHFSLSLRKCPTRQLFISNPSNTNVLCLNLSPHPQTTPSKKTLLNAQFVTHLDISHYADRPPISIFGLLGVTHMGSDDVFLGVIVDAEQVAIMEDSQILKITQVAFISLSNDLYDSTSTKHSSLTEEDTPINTSPNSGSQSPITHPCDQLTRLFSTGLFYFSSSLVHNKLPLDLSTTYQYRTTSPNPKQDTQYIWNSFLLEPLTPIMKNMQASNMGDPSCLLVQVIHGYVGKFSLGPKSLALVSRMSTNRAGTRYNTRGIDDSGSVANFVETEMIYTTATHLLSYVQVRGSVPVFWDQQGLQVVGHKIQISRSRDATRPAFLRHFSTLASQYGYVSAINLVAQDASSEGVLAAEYQAHMKALDTAKLVDFDFHAETKGNNYAALSKLMTMVAHDLNKIACFLLDLQTNQVVMQQQGVFRVNCVDCLDRTNVVLGLIGDQALRKFASGIPTQFQDEFKDLWANNGDCISRIYAGTGALKSGFTRSGKRTIAGFLDDSVKSVGRFVINNFQDKSRQETIDTLLGKLNVREIAIHDPVFDEVKKQVHAQCSQFMSIHQLHIHVGTYNVNGKLPQEPIDAWIKVPGSTITPHLFAIGFQEIVELTPGQIVSADPMKRQMWQQELVTAIRRSYGSEYILVCDAQLVGAAIMIYAKSQLTEHIHLVETCVVKTGLGGMAGNKGGLAVTMTIYNTPICFVTAHFASGQGSVEDRNRDFLTIMNDVTFKRGRNIAQDHDHLIWFGDFNYRIDLDNLTVRHKIKHDQVHELCSHDQLTKHRLANKTFHGFQEGRLGFAPTYKYDNGTNTYDTSEKCRIPGWCDRILYKSQPVSKCSVFGTLGYVPLKLIHYDRAELLLSDHKPVCAQFQVSVARMDNARKHAMYQSLLSSNPVMLTNTLVQVQQLPMLISFLDDDNNNKEEDPRPVHEPGCPNPWMNHNQLGTASSNRIAPVLEPHEFKQTRSTVQQQQWNLLD